MQLWTLTLMFPTLIFNLKELLLVVVHKNLFYVLAPILYHTSVDGNSAYYCTILIEFVDSYILFILLIIFLLALALSKNWILTKILEFNFKFKPRISIFNLLRSKGKPTLLKSILNKIFLNPKPFKDCFSEKKQFYY